MIDRNTIEKAEALKSLGITFHEAIVAAWLISDNDELQWMCGGLPGLFEQLDKAVGIPRIIAKGVG